MASSEDIEKLKRLAEISRTLGQPEVELEALQALKRLGALENAPQRLPSIKSQAEKAMANAAPDYGAGLVFLGRGFDNLLKGGRNLVAHGVEALGLLPPAMAQGVRRDIARDREYEDRAYVPLKKKYGDVAEMGEFVGETSPFFNLPVGRLESVGGKVGELASRPIVGFPLRASPEAVAGAAEAGLPYHEDQAERAATGALGAPVGRLATDWLSRRANMRRERFNPDVQEFYDLGREFNVPVRRGTLEDQLAAADAAAQTHFTGRGSGQIGYDVYSDLTSQMANRENKFRKWHQSLFDNMDMEIDTRPIKAEAKRLFDIEKARGSMADDALLTEYSRWAKMPLDKMTIKDLHLFRDDLRSRMKSGGPRAEQWSELEDMVSKEIYDAADRLAPGFGDAIKNLDTWYYTDIERIKKIPGVRGALSESPTPQKLLTWLLTKPDQMKQDVFDVLSDSGKRAVGEALWNQAYRVGARGSEFNPLNYAKYIESNLEAAQRFLPHDEFMAMQNLAKLMRHIAGEGRTADNHFLRLLRGFPFMYRAATDAIRRSNFRFQLAHAPPDIRPGSPEMERFYRSIIRSYMIQEDETQDALIGSMGSVLDELPGPLVDQARPIIGRLAPSSN